MKQGMNPLPSNQQIRKEIIMRITDRLTFNREISVKVRERAYAESWDRPRWADGTPIPTGRDADPVPATSPDTDPQPTATPIIQERDTTGYLDTVPSRQSATPAPIDPDAALTRLEQAAENAGLVKRPDPLGGLSTGQIIKARKRRIMTGHITPTHVETKHINADGSVTTIRTDEGPHHLPALITQAS